MRKGKGIALLPIGVFLVLYLGLGILFEYVMEIPMGFYNVPIVVAFLAAILVACLQNRSLDFDKKLQHGKQIQYCHKKSGNDHSVRVMSVKIKQVI